jgi:hypothetical protein
MLRSAEATFVEVVGQDPAQTCAGNPRPSGEPVNVLRQHRECLERLASATNTPVALGPVAVSGPLLSDLAEAYGIATRIRNVKEREDYEQQVAEHKAEQERRWAEEAKEAKEEKRDAEAARREREAADQAPYLRPCTPNPVTMSQLERHTHAPMVQQRDDAFLECRDDGPSWKMEIECTKHGPTVFSTWCEFLLSMCQDDEGRWRNPDDCGVGNAELKPLDDQFCPAFVKKNRGSKTAKPTLRSRHPIFCAVPPHVPPGGRLFLAPTR